MMIGIPFILSLLYLQAILEYGFDYYIAGTISGFSPMLCQRYSSDIIVDNVTTMCPSVLRHLLNYQ
jgi:tetrahydromethanopterin S-methyltransferase subunit D